MDNLPRKPIGQPRKNTNDTTFNNSYEKIYARFSEGVSCAKVAEEFNVSRQAAHLWRKSWFAWLEFTEEPPIIKKIKKEAEKEVKANTINRVLKESSMRKAVSRKTAEIDKLRLRGLNLSNKILDRMEEIVDEEKSMGGLAKALAAILPYVATKQDGDSDKGLTPDEKRMAFVKNVMNVYNINVKSEDADDDENELQTINIDDYESIEDDYSDWDPEE